MTNKITYTIEIQTKPVENASTGLSFGASAFSPEQSPVLNQRPINATNFSDGVLDSFITNETDKHLEISSNFLIRQGMLVRNHIQGISLLGECGGNVYSFAQSNGDFKILQAKTNKVYVSRIQNDIYDALDSGIQTYVFKRKNGRVYIHESASPYNISYLDSETLLNFQNTYRDYDYTYTFVGLNNTNILNINGIRMKKNPETIQDVLDSHIKYGIEPVNLLDGFDAIELKTFGIVPESDYDEIRVGTTYYPVSSYDPIIVGLKFGAGIAFLHPNQYKIYHSTGEIVISKEEVDLAYQNIDMSFLLTHKVKQIKKDLLGNIVFEADGKTPVYEEVDEEFSFIDANQNSGSLYEVVALYDTAPMTYYGTGDFTINKLDIVDHNDNIVLLDVDTYDTQISNFVLQDKRIMLDTGTWDSKDKMFTVQHNHTFMRTPSSKKKMFAESSVPIVINGHMINGGKRLVFKSSVLNSMWCRASMDIFDLSIPTKMSDFLIEDMGDGTSRYTFTSSEQITPEVATLLGNFKTGIIPRMSIAADVNRPQDKVTYTYSKDADGNTIANFNTRFEGDIYDNTGVQFRYMENDNKHKNIDGILKQGVYQTRNWTLSQFYIQNSDPLNVPIDITPDDKATMIDPTKKVSFSFNINKTGRSVILPSWPDMDQVELYQVNRRFLPDGTYYDVDEPFDDWKIQSPDILVFSPDIPIGDVTFRIKYNHAIYPKVFHVDVENKKFAFYVKNNIPLNVRYPTLTEFRIAMQRAGEVRFGYVNSVGQVVYVPERLKFEVILTPDYLRMLTLKYKEVLW